ncbi:MAG: hypothetical protein WC047_00680, partial [Kiritimatiellales bacterium]
MAIINNHAGHSKRCAAECDSKYFQTLEKTDRKVPTLGSECNERGSADAGQRPQGVAKSGGAKGFCGSFADVRRQVELP